jgi:DNA primase
VSLPEFIQRHHEHGLKSKVLIDYVASRGLTLEDVKPFNLGYYTWNVRDEKTFAVPRMFNNSIVFPVYDELQPVGFELRRLDIKRHYKWFTPKPDRYKFFGMTKTALESIYETEEVFLTEGTFDQITLSLWRPNVLALMTNKVSEEQHIFLKRYVKKAYLCLDFDKWGIIQAQKIYQSPITTNVQFHLFEYLRASDGANDANKYLQNAGKDNLLRTLNLRWKLSKL